MAEVKKNRPYTTVVLAMSADGKIADQQRSPARFSSSTDKLHLEQQIARADGVLFGSETLRAYGTTLRVSHPQLLAQRDQQNLPPQPIQIVVSRAAELDSKLPFFRQPVPRWLLTTVIGAQQWQGCLEFEQILVFETASATGIDWKKALAQMINMGLQHLAVLGGGELIASLLAEDLIDEFWLTVCPLILGGATAPTPVAGLGFSTNLAPRLELLSVEKVEQEVYLHYRRKRGERLTADS